MTESSLPTCRHRGDAVTITAPGSGATRTAFECWQVHIRGRGDDPAHVSAAACGDCGYSDAAFDSAKENFRGAKIITREIFLSRYSHCVECKFRSANFCNRAAGDCSLTQKLTKADFRCPAGHFAQVEPQSPPPAENQGG